jgi:hypothetical protein
MLHIIKLALKGFSPSPLGMRLAGGRDFIVRRMCLRGSDSGQVLRDFGSLIFKIYGRGIRGCFCRPG